MTPLPVTMKMMKPLEIRADHTCESFLEQPVTLVDNRSDSAGSFMNESTEKVGVLVVDSRSFMFAKNLQNLHVLGGVNTLLDFVITLPSIDPFIRSVEEAVEESPFQDAFLV